jgi:flagellar motor switch protein FliG
MDAASVADLIRNEHPQIIATILVHLEFDHAGDILKHFTDRLRNDVLLRIATLDGVQPVALRELNEALTRILANSAANVKKTAMGGIRHAAEILNFVGQRNETAIIDNVREYDPDLAQKILDEMFVFENLLDVDRSTGIQLLLREVQSDAADRSRSRAPRRNCARRYSRTCRSAPPKCCAKTSNRRAGALVRGRAGEQKEILKIAAAWPKKARSSSGGLAPGAHVVLPQEIKPTAPVAGPTTAGAAAPSGPRQAFAGGRRVARSRGRRRRPAARRPRPAHTDHTPLARQPPH